MGPHKGRERHRGLLSENTPISPVSGPRNDNMGLGALEALRTAGLAGKIPVVGIDGTSEAINATIAEEFAATVNNDPMWQGGMGLSSPYSAKTGVFDPAKEPKEHREFYFEPVYVNTENAQEVKTNYIDGIPNYDWNGSLGPRAGLGN